MNELDLDKLLSMEDPLPEAKPKPEPEPAAPTPMPTEPEPEAEPDAEKLPQLTKLQRTGIAVLAALILAIGFFAGYLFRSSPTPPPETTDPPITTMPPETTVPALPAKVIFSDSMAVCHAYQESIEIITNGEQACFYDGATQYRLGETVELNRFDPGYYNIWIRIELTQAGKERFGDGGTLQIDRDVISSQVDWANTYLVISPYYVDGDSAPGGWLICGWLSLQAQISFQLDNSDGQYHRLDRISFDPVICDSNLLHFSTKMLAQLALNDRTFWKEYSDQLPEDLTPSPALQALSQRESSISILMEALLKGESAEQKHAIAILKHKSFLDMMTGDERWAFYDMVDEYFTVTVYDQTLTQAKTSPLAGEKQGSAYLLDSETAYRLGSPIPEPTEGEDPINFIARVELSPYYRTQYQDSWKLEADGMRARTYYNSDGQVAGWFVFGYLLRDAELEFRLTGGGATNIPVYTVTCSVSPRSQLIFAKTDNSGDSPDNSYWLEQNIVYQNNQLICYAYRELPQLSTMPGVTGVLLPDGAVTYHLWENPENIAHIDPANYNVWIRIELTEEGRKKYPNPDMLWLEDNPYGMPVQQTAWLGITPYDTNGAMEGWFLFGCATIPGSVTLARQGMDVISPIAFQVKIDPLWWPVDESVLWHTDFLIEQILTNNSMWETFGDKVPDDLSEWPQLYELSRRRNAIDTLLNRYTYSSATVWPRIDLLLNHPAFLSQMTADQIALREQSSQSRFSFATFPQPLTEYADGSNHYFTDGTTSWRISDSIPTALLYLDESDFNCFIQVSLSDFCRQSCYDGWNLRARSSSIGAVLGTREYYDDSGALAGWFVYGKLSGEAEVTFWLENENAKTVESISQPLSPLA